MKAMLLHFTRCVATLNNKREEALLSASNPAPLQLTVRTRRSN